MINYRNGYLGEEPQIDCFLNFITIKLLNKCLETLNMGNKFGFSFSWKRALGITSAKQKFARDTGIPTTKSGVERKIGSVLLKLLFGKK
jgi:hypothetical protein